MHKCKPSPPTYWLKVGLQWEPLFFPHKHLYPPVCVVFACDQSRSPLLPLSLTDYGNLFPCFPSCLSLHLARGASWLKVLDARAIRRHVRHSAWTRAYRLSCLNCIIMHDNKQCEESGRTNGPRVKRSQSSLNRSGLTRATHPLEAGQTVL